MLTNLLYLLLLIAGFPTGFLFVKLCKNEIQNWKGRLFIISVLSLFLAVVVSFIPITIYVYKFPTIISLFFMIIVCLTIVWKSY